MASLFVLGLTLIAAAASADPSRIIGGTPVRIEQHASTLQVEALSGSIWVHHCGGTILNTRFILSAAQCFSGRDYSPETRRIRAGSAIRESGGVIAYIVREFNHPTYGRNGFDGDISVIRLATALMIFHPTDNTMRHSPFVAANTNIMPGIALNKVGWGITGPNTDRSRELQVVVVRVTDHAICRYNYATIPNAPPVTDNMICATSTTGIGDACTGDQGGPLFLFHNILVGVISWSYGCAMPGFPGVSTRIASYSDWIQEILRS